METKKKILLVDDDMDVITVVEAILKRDGYEVLSAGNKEEGMKLVKSWKPDLAILDVMMETPYEGFELAKQIKEDAQTSTTPVLMQTSIDVLITTRPGVQEMAREFRNDPNYRDLEVILLKNVETGDAGVDYRSVKGENVYFPVNGFIRKPVSSDRLLTEVHRLLKN